MNAHYNQLVWQRAAEVSEGDERDFAVAKALRWAAVRAARPALVMKYQRIIEQLQAKIGGAREVSDIMDRGAALVPLNAAVA